MKNRRKKIRAGDWVRGTTCNKQFTFYGYVTFIKNETVKVKVTQMWDKNNEKVNRDYAEDLPIFARIELIELFEFNLNIEDIKGMIDFAMDIRDKRLFNKYTKILKETLEERQHADDGFRKGELIKG